MKMIQRCSHKHASTVTVVRIPQSLLRQTPQFKVSPAWRVFYFKKLLLHFVLDGRPKQREKKTYIFKNFCVHVRRNVQ